MVIRQLLLSRLLDLRAGAGDALFSVHAPNAVHYIVPSPFGMYEVGSSKAGERAQLFGVDATGPHHVREIQDSPYLTVVPIPPFAAR